MNSRLIEIAELLTEVSDIIQDYNSMVNWRGNRIISVYIDKTGDEQRTEILMSKDIPETGRERVKSSTKKDFDGGYYFFTKTAYNDKVKFSMITNVKEAGERAEMVI